MKSVDTPKPWLRGVLEPCLLALLVEGETYGYELGVRLEAAGLGKVPGGSLYPALLRMEKQALVRADWRAGDGGPGRKYYALTDAGRRVVGEQAHEWLVFAETVGGVLRPHATTPTASTGGASS